MSDSPKFINTDTIASLPGRIPVTLRVWLRCFPRKLLLPMGILVLIFAPILFLMRSGSVLGLVLTASVAAGLTLFVVWWQITRIREHFAYGCINPAKVVSAQPYLIAVSGDLGLRHGDSWPVIKILPQPLDRTGGRRARVGEKIATVALYFGTGDQGHWEGFEPIAAECVTDNAKAIQNAIQQLDKFQEVDVWDELEKHLALVPKPYQPGLYWMRK